MLVCNVSQKARRAAIAANVIEAATALDQPGTGNVVFATLVDDPASVGEFVDGYLGEVMLEAASAGDTVDASLPATYAVDVAEAATAVETTNGTVAAAFTATAWDPATVASATLSGSNLIVTNTGTSSGDQGARAPSSAGKTSGKYYYEITITTKAGGGNAGVGAATTASTYTAMGNNATAGSECFASNGAIYSNSTNTGFAVVAPANGTIIGIAIDLDNRKAWFRNWMAPVGPADGWNGIQSLSSQNPATNTGGVTVPAGTIAPLCTFGGSGGVSGNVYTANFGGTVFTGAVPSGFTSGWPA